MKKYLKAIWQFCSYVFVPQRRPKEDVRCMKEKSLIQKLEQFLEDEARSCSMDFGCVTPEYVYRMWGGSIALEDIEEAMAKIKFPGR